MLGRRARIRFSRCHSAREKEEDNELSPEMCSVVFLSSVSVHVRGEGREEISMRPAACMQIVSVLRRNEGKNPMLHKKRYDFRAGGSEWLPPHNIVFTCLFSCSLAKAMEV